MSGFLRVVAVLMGLVFVTGGGSCVLTGVPFFFDVYSHPGPVFHGLSTSKSLLGPIGIGICIGAAVLIAGVFLLKFGFRKTKPANKEMPPASTALGQDTLGQDHAGGI